jgi:dTDP-L-rhamnose 4-epimerase
MARVLITGGAGFIGSHLADELLQYGHAVKVIDVLCSQVHGTNNQSPEYLNPDVELVCGDVRDRAAVERALQGIDAVYHFAAAVGVGQSMYEVEHYASINDIGTAVLLEALIKRPVERLIVASSMSIYGEGLYRSRLGAIQCAVERTPMQLRSGVWDPVDDQGVPLEPIPTPESKSPALSSVYALSKYVQERMCLMIGRAYNIPAVGLRFFNVYGPRQALSNPYTGVLAIFASRLLNGKAPMIFEDGEQRRDFVNVRDVVQACRLCLDAAAAADKVFNIGSGQAYSIRELAERMADALGKNDLEPNITGKYRVGDIRHCFADVALARSVLGYAPQVTLEDGVLELVDWLEGQIANDSVESASAELAARGLTL